MPRKDAYVCSLTTTVVERIERVLDCMVDIDYKSERRKAALEIKFILRSKSARHGIRPKIKELGPM